MPGESYAQIIDIVNKANNADTHHGTHHQTAHVARPSGCATSTMTLSTMNAQEPGDDEGQQRRWLSQQHHEHLPIKQRDNTDNPMHNDPTHHSSAPSTDNDNMPPVNDKLPPTTPM